MILLIDNYDSFTYNLYQAIGQLYEDITVIRNDKLTIEQIQNMQPEAIIISPAPVTQKMQASLLPLSRNSAEPFQF